MDIISEGKRLDSKKLNLSHEKLRSYCDKWKITELSLFGSVLRDDFGPDSDIDFLATYAIDAEWDLCDHAEMQDELALMVRRRVDLLDRETIEACPNWIFRKSVLTSAIFIHVRQ